jgi:hypothetical protein
MAVEPVGQMRVEWGVVIKGTYECSKADAASVASCRSCVLRFFLGGDVTDSFEVRRSCTPIRTFKLALPQRNAMRTDLLQRE